MRPQQRTLAKASVFVNPPTAVGGLNYVLPVYNSVELYSARKCGSTVVEPLKIAEEAIFWYDSDMKYEYFVSTRWRNRDQALKLMKELRDLGKSVYFFMESTPSSEIGKIEDDPNEVMKKYEAIPNWREDKRIKHIFATDMQGLHDSETFLFLLPAGKSCHMEADAAYGLGKRMILIGQQKETESLYLMFNEVYSTIDEFVTSLR